MPWIAFERKGPQKKMEAAPGFEPGNNGFADEDEGNE
jgi:hypothetical protein